MTLAIGTIISTGTLINTAQAANQAPDCSQAIASPNSIWPPNNKLIPVKITGVSDPRLSHKNFTCLSINSRLAIESDKFSIAA